MKILHVIPSLEAEHGGPTIALVGLCQELARRGHNVEIFTTTSRKQSVNSSLPQQNGVTINYFDRSLPIDYYFSRHFRNVIAARITEFDLVHIHTLWRYPTWAAGYWARKKRVPYIIRPCGMIDKFCMEQKKLKKAIYARLRERANLNGARAIHFTSEYELQESRDFGLSSPSVVVPLGIRTDDYTTLPAPGTFAKTYPETANKRLVLFLGRLHPIKGLDLLIGAFANLRKEFPDVHLIFAGPDEQKYGNSLRKSLLQKGLLPQVTFTGFLDHSMKLAAFRDAHIFCLPSYHENFGLACVEGMLCGLPVVVSNRVSISKEIETQKAGLVVPCSVPEIQNALRQLLGNDQLRIDLGSKGKMLAVSQFSWERIAPEMIKLYERCINSPTPI